MPAPLTLLFRYALVLACALLAGCISLPKLTKTAEAPVQPVTPESPRPSVVCSPLQGNPFAMRKKVLVLGMPVQRPLEATDLPDLDSAWSRALQQRLQATDHFLVRDGSGYFPGAQENVRKEIIALAKKFDAQIVIAGLFTSLGSQAGRIPLGQLGSVPRPFGDQRVMEIELDLYDGYSGTRLKRLRHETRVEGDVTNQGSAPLRGGFFLTPLGQAMSAVLDRQVADIEDELACLPLQARIVHAKSRDLQVDVGFTSNIRPGDVLRVIQPTGIPVGEGGQIEKSMGNLEIKDVFPESATGQFVGDPLPDWGFSTYIRAW